MQPNNKVQSDSNAIYDVLLLKECKTYLLSIVHKASISASGLIKANCNPLEGDNECGLWIGLGYGLEIKGRDRG